MLKSAHAHVLNAQTQVCLRVHMYTHALVCTCMCMLQSTCMHTHVRMGACGVCKDCGVCQLDKQLVLGLLQHLMHRTCSVHYLRSTYATYPQHTCSSLLAPQILFCEGTGVFNLSRLCLHLFSTQSSTLLSSRRTCMHDACTLALAVTCASAQACICECVCGCLLLHVHRPMGKPMGITCARAFT